MVADNDAVDVNIAKEKDEDAPNAKQTFWCNFCQFESDDLQDYLSHSCRAVILDRGESIPESKGEECR